MLDMFLNPESVAVVGASPNPTKLGHRILSNLVRSNFKVRFTHQPSASEILGLKTYPSLLDVPGSVEEIVIVCPPRPCPASWKRQAEGRAGGHRHHRRLPRDGKAGAELEGQVIEIAKKHNIRVIGPNCLGIIDMWCPWTWPLPTTPPRRFHRLHVTVWRAGRRRTRLCLANYIDFRTLPASATRPTWTKRPCSSTGRTSITPT